MSGSRLPRRLALGLRRGGGVALLTAFLGIATAAPAAAHPYLLSSNPTNGAVLPSAPAQLDINYTEGLDLPYSKVVLVAPDGRRITTHQVKADGPTELSVVPDTALAEQGTYAVDWTAVGDDGHTVIGTFSFSVDHPTANPAVQSAGNSVTGSAASPGGARRLIRTVLPLATVVFAALLLLARVMGSAGQRASRLRWSALVLVVGLEVVLAALTLASGGASEFGSSATGRRLIAELVLSGFAVPAVIDPRRWRIAGIAALGLLVVLADSGHAASQPDSRRALALAVYSVHLIAVSVWIGALLAVLLRLGAKDGAADAQRSLRALVGVSLLAVLGTGIATTDWGLRTLSDVPDTLWGKLALTKLSLFVVLVTLGLVAGWVRLRGNGRLSRALIVGEAVVAAGALIVAGVLGEVSQPLDDPYASQTYAASTGVPVAVTATGEDALDVATLAPGTVGRNSLVVEVGESDEQDFLSPADGVGAVSATLSCGGCGAPDQQVALHSNEDKTSWVADVSLPRAAEWLVTAKVARGGESHTARFAERVSPVELPDQVVVGVPASLSGATGQLCRDQVVGLQVALQDVNTKAGNHGDLIRVVAVDLDNGVTAAMERLRAVGARVIALPCGTPSEVGAATNAARAAGLPVIGGAASTNAPGVWSTHPSWRAEGAAIAAQAQRQGASAVTAVVGSTAIDRTELAGLRSALVGESVALRVASFRAGGAKLVTGLARRNADLVALLGDRTEAAPLVRVLSDTGWQPTRGILASAQLMSTDFINDAGTITRRGGIEFASDTNPFDPVSQYYAQRLRALVPGIRPTFDGLHGYQAGLAIAQGLRDGGGSPSASSLTHLLASRFANFTVGSFRLGWGATGGTSTSLAFFRSTYVNPMAMPVNTPGGAAALAHEGTFLDSGGFEQVAPFRRIT